MLFLEHSEQRKYIIGWGRRLDEAHRTLMLKLELTELLSIIEE